MQESQKLSQGYKLLKLNRYTQITLSIIPEQWEIVTVGNITKEHKQGFYTNEAYSNDGIKLVRITDLLNPYLSYETMPLLKLDEKTINDFRVRKGDFLIARSGAIGRFGIVKEDIPCVFASYIIRFLFDSKRIHNEFLGYLFQTLSIRKQLEIIQQGSSNININAENIKSIKIPLPPKEEQESIIFILSKLDELIQKTDQIIERTQRLKEGLMQKLLTKGVKHANYCQTEIGEIPMEWHVSTIGNEFKVGTGGTPSRNNPSYFEGNIPWIKTSEIKFNMIKSSQEHITQQALEESSAKLYPKGTLLMAMYGEGATRGKCAILDIEAAINQACAAIVSLDKLEIKFIFYWLQWQYDNIRNKSHGTHQSNLNLGFVKSLKIPCPPLPEQKRIVQILSDTDIHIEKCQHYKTAVTHLKKGLVQKLLTGKIRVKV